MLRRNPPIGMEKLEPLRHEHRRVPRFPVVIAFRDLVQPPSGDAKPQHLRRGTVVHRFPCVDGIRAPLLYFSDQIQYQISGGARHPIPTWDVLDLGPLRGERKLFVGKSHPLFVAHLQEPV